MIFRVPTCALRASAGMGAERSRRRSAHKVHDCDENREGNNPENSAVKGITNLYYFYSLSQVIKELSRP
ncbi:MAG: hypothetical protein U1E78_00195 [Gammaproteobacteria bacterium]